MGQKEAGRPSRLRGVHACVHWCGVGGLSLQEHAAQPGSLGLGEVSGIRILSVPRSPWHRDWEDEGRLWEGCKEPQPGSPALGASQPSHSARWILPVSGAHLLDVQDTSTSMAQPPDPLCSAVWGHWWCTGWVHIPVLQLT